MRGVVVLVVLGLWWLLVTPMLAQSDPLDLHRAIDLGGLDARSAALILSGEEGGELDISVLALVLEETSVGRRLALVIDIPEVPDTEEAATEEAATEEAGTEEAGTEEARDNSESLHVTEIYVYALDSQEQLAGYLTQGFQRDRDARRDVKFFAHLDLAPGSYSLRVLVLQRDFARMGLQIVPVDVTAETAAADLANLDSMAAESWYLVVESGAADFPLVTDGRPVIPATRPSAAVEMEVRAAPPSSRAEVRRRRDVVAGYVEVLHLLVQGREAPAIQVLSDFERLGLAGEVEVVFVPSLMELVGRFADLDRDSLVPLIHLHEQLYRQHYLERDYRLATHARQMAVGLVEIYNRSFLSPDPAAGVLTANVFVSLGGFLQQLGSAQQARPVFEEALKHDPTSLAALLGLASIHEAFDDPGEATELLKRLLVLQPDHAEARLRMAVNLRRQGATRKAAALFRACLETDTSDNWIRSLAFQELARLHVAGGRFDDALALLTEALEWRPGNQRFYIQLAALHDQMEQGVKARRVLDRLDATAGRRDESPRLVYSRWPFGDVEETRRWLAEASAGRLKNLAEVLEGFAGSAGK